MRRFATPMMLGALAAAALSSPAAAQKPFAFLGGGVTFPMGSYKDYAKTGWVASAGFGVELGTKGAWVDAEVYYGSNNHSDIAGDKTRIPAGMLALGYQFSPGKKVRPYVTGGAGFLTHRYKPVIAANATSETKLGVTGAAGLNFVVGPEASFYVEGRYLGGKDTSIIPIMVGITISFGKS